MKERRFLLTKHAFSLQASFHERVRSHSNWQHAQVMLTKKREALVKLELASKNEKLPQAQEEVKEVRILNGHNYCTQTGPSIPQKDRWSLHVPPFPHLKRWCLVCIAPTLSGVDTKKKIQTSVYHFSSNASFMHT